MAICACVSAALAAVCAAAGEGGGGDCSGDCGNCNCDCFSGDCCPGGGDVIPADGAGAGAGDFFWSGPFPYDPWWGYSNWHIGSGGGGGDCNCGVSCKGCCSSICRPIGWLFYVFPVAPDNAWGGIVGRCMGTHAMTTNDRMYQADPGHWFVEFMRMRWRHPSRDLHRDDAWRVRVRDFLRGADVFPTQAGPRPARQAFHRTTTEYTPEMTTVMVGERRVTNLSPTVRAVHVDRPFDKVGDNCVSSSFDDYKKNECWICTGSNDNWDLWLSCHHLFCEGCSTEMLRRRMPCPLCRVGSSTVLRGKKYEELPDGTGDSGYRSVNGASTSSGFL